MTATSRFGFGRRIALRLLCRTGIHKRGRGVTGFIDRCERCGEVLPSEGWNDYTPY